MIWVITPTIVITMKSDITKEQQKTPILNTFNSTKIGKNFME